MVPRARALLVLAVTGCATPAAFPRPADVAPVGRVTGEIKMQLASIEPQTFVAAAGQRVSASTTYGVSLVLGFDLGPASRPPKER